MIDPLITYQLDLARLDAHTRAKVDRILTKMRSELRAALASGDLSRKARADALLSRAQQIIAESYGVAETIAATTTQGVIPISAAAASAALATMLPPSIDVATPALDRLAGDVLLMGAPQSEWWAKQSADTAWRFVTTVRQGIANAETNQQIIARVLPVLDVSRRNAAALVQTGLASVSNGARQALFDANADLIARYRWLTALDGHVCPLCAARADMAWTVGHKPIGHAIPWGPPPIHFNDRCILTPETKTWRELGIDAPEPPPGMRASRDGPVPATMTFRQWLDSKSAAFQDETLGAGRAQLWRDGKITLQDLISGNGRPLTLEQLRERYAAQ